MEEMLHELNQSTQPIRPYRIFNNWDVVVKGWYVVAKSRALKRGKTLSVLIGGHQLALFRTESGKAKALDAFCPHMGMDLADGKVVGETVSCHFHHWKFDGDGNCVDIPCLKRAPAERFPLQSYPVEEKYGYLWVSSDPQPREGVFEIDELKGKPILFATLAPFRRIAHPHITMMNSIDEQHFRTVHKFDMNFSVTTEENSRRFLTTLKAEAGTNTWVGKLQTFLFGKSYASSVLFVDGCVALLTTFIGVKLFDRIPFPKGYYIFSQTFRRKGETLVYPIIVTERRRGFLGFLASWLYVQINRASMKFLAWQDGHTVYRGLRFRQDGLLKDVDGPTARWISFVNRALEPSIWSKPGAGTKTVETGSTRPVPEISH